MQCKKRGTRYPGYMQEWLDGLGRPSGKIPIVVWGLKQRRTGDALVYLRLGDFCELLGKGTDATSAEE